MQSVTWTIAAALALAGCAGGALPPVDASRMLSPASAEAYRLSVGDKIKVTVYKEETLSGEYSVDARGMIAMPVVGDVRAEGRTTGDVANTVRTGLAKGFMVDPQVSAEVAAYRPVYVLGEVNKPGRYDYTIGLTALGAVAAAEGFSYRADEKRIFIKSPEEPGERELRVTPDLIVRPGEIIRVQARTF